MDDSELQVFKLQIAELDLQWDEMEPALRDKLRLSEQARAVFWPYTDVLTLQPMIPMQAASQRQQQPTAETSRLPLRTLTWRTGPSTQ